MAEYYTETIVDIALRSVWINGVFRPLIFFDIIDLTSGEKCMFGML